MTTKSQLPWTIPETWEVLKQGDMQLYGLFVGVVGQPIKRMVAIGAPNVLRGIAQELNVNHYQILID